MRQVLLLCGIVIIMASRTALATCSGFPNEPDICCQGPGVPSPGFNQCGSSTTHWSLSTVPAPSSIRMSITAFHAVWWDPAPAPTYNRLYWVDHGSSCQIAPTTAKEVYDSYAVEGQDTIANGSNPKEAFIYFDTPGRDLRGVRLPANRPFKPLPSARGDQMVPGASDHGKGFAYMEEFDIWYCGSFECPKGGERITKTPEREFNPRIHGERVVWENHTTGEVLYFKGPGAAPIVVDKGRQPDINAKWIVYIKDVPAPDPACHWQNHTQIWAYGPLDSANPKASAISAVGYWGAANYTWPRLTEDYVVFKVDYLYAHKTVIGIYPTTGFGQSNVAMLEVDDAGDPTNTQANLDAWQESPSVVHVLYRHILTHGATLRCCTP